MTTVTTDYTDRLLDIYLAQGLDPLKSGKQVVTYSFGPHTKYVAGILKLSQRYVISLVNSGFVEKLLGLSNNNVSVAKTAFVSYSWDVVKSFREYQSKNLNMPPDEQINTADLMGVTTNQDSATFNVKLTSNSGASVSVTLPLPI